MPDPIAPVIAPASTQTPPAVPAATVAPVAPAASVDPAVAAPPSTAAAPVVPPASTETPAITALPGDDADSIGNVEPSQELIDAEKIAAEAKAKKDDEAKASADAPVTFKPAESLKMSADAVAAWGEVFKDAGVTNEQAQKLADALAKRQEDPEVQKIVKEQAEKEQAEKKKKQVADDLAVMRALPVLGGANLPTTIKKVREVLSSSKEGVAFSKWLQDRGHGSDPVVIALLANIADSRSDDSTGRRLSGTSPAPKQPAPPASDSVAAWTKVGSRKAVAAK